MARLRLLKLERSKVDAVLGMDRALASHALPTAGRDVDIKRVDLDAPADAAGALSRRHQGRPAAQKRIEHDVAGAIALPVYREVFVSFNPLRPRHTSRLHTRAASLYSNGAGALSSHGVRYTMVFDDVSRLFQTIIGSTVCS